MFRLRFKLRPIVATVTASATAAATALAKPAAILVTAAGVVLAPAAAGCFFSSGPQSEPEPAFRELGGLLVR